MGHWLSDDPRPLPAAHCHRGGLWGARGDGEGRSGRTELLDPAGMGEKACRRPAEGPA